MDPGKAEAGVLLDWYDRGARKMPWRVSPQARAGGVRADPYAVWLSEVMLQQTTVAAVGRYFTAFLARWPRVEDLAAAADAEVMAAWAGLGYYARARNLLRCARVVTEVHGGRFPDTEDGLRALPGIGPYTAAAVAAIAFDRRAVVLDGNVERVMARLHAVEAPLPGAKETLRALAGELTPDARPGDYAQAVMDLGATICTPRAPACGICPWRAPCAARARGDPETFPRKAARANRPTRRGIAYLGVAADGAVLLEARPGSGLLGGMLGLPGSDWVEGEPMPRPPFAAAWRDAGAVVRHTFTHFHLELSVQTAPIPGGAVLAGQLYPPTPGLEASLPTVMRKALRLGLSAAAPS